MEEKTTLEYKVIIIARDSLIIYNERPIGSVVEVQGKVQHGPVERTSLDPG